MSVGLALLPTKGPIEAARKVHAATRREWAATPDDSYAALCGGATMAPLKVLGGLGTGESWVVWVFLSSRVTCHIDASHPVEFGPAGYPLPAAPEAGPRS